jgi:hypothetical protein
MKREFAFVSLVAAAVVLFGASSEKAQATTVAVTFTKLTGITGGSPAGTAVYQANLSSLSGQIASVTIADNSGGLGGAGGQFSGFDLDAIVLSTVSIADASQVGLLVPAAAFNFATSVLTPGTQRAPADPALFGTTGGQVNNGVATLGTFDGNSTTVIPGAAGFVSLGDNGVLSINLLSSLALGGPLFLYIGEVGDNGEVAASGITISDTPVSGTPLPAAFPLFASGVAAFGWLARRKRKALTA